MTYQFVAPVHCTLQVDTSMLSRWFASITNPVAKQRPGAKPQFLKLERSLLNRILIMRRIGNVPISRKMGIHLAKALVKFDPRFRDCTLKFSNNWWMRFVRRAFLVHRQVTTTRDNLTRPSAATILAATTVIQEHQVELKLEPHAIFYADEFCLMYEHPRGRTLDRKGVHTVAAHASSTTKMSGHCFTDGTGKFPAMLFVLQAGEAGQPDQHRGRLLQDLHRATDDTFFSKAKGWSHGIYEKTIERPDKKGGVKSILYKRPFLYNRSVCGSGIPCLLSVQPKSWIDSIGHCMFLEKVVGELAYARGGTVQLVMDNCSVHKTAEVKELAERYNVVSDFLAPNSTDKCQVADVLVIAGSCV